MTDYDKLLNDLTEIQLKVQGLRPLNMLQVKELRGYYKIGLTWSSNALEGNSLTETETKVAIEDGLTAGGKPIRDYYEAIGHAESYDFLYEIVESEAFTEDQIKKLHHLFYHRIDHENAGNYRNMRVFISGSRHTLPSPEEVPDKMKEFVDKLGKNPGLHPVEWAAQVHKEFVFIHPFVDGNGRMTRLLMNFALLKSGYAIAIIPPIRRIDYIVALEKAHNNDSAFRQFIAEVVYQSQLEYVRLMG